MSRPPRGRFTTALAALFLIGAVAVITPWNFLVLFRECGADGASKVCSWLVLMCFVSGCLLHLVFRARACPAAIVTTVLQLLYATLTASLASQACVVGDPIPAIAWPEDLDSPVYWTLSRGGRMPLCWMTYVAFTWLLVMRSQIIARCIGWERARLAIQILFLFTSVFCALNSALAFADVAMRPKGADAVRWHNIQIYGIAIMSLLYIGLLLVTSTLFAVPAVVLHMAAGEATRQCSPDRGTIRTLARAAVLQAVAVFVNVCIQIMVVVFLSMMPFKPSVYRHVETCTWLDMFANVIVMLVLSGGCSMEGIRKNPDGEAANAMRHQRRLAGQRSQRLCPNDEWKESVKDLAVRGVSLDQLLAFYMRLPLIMPHYKSSLHTTTDVVRQAIIPECADLQCALAAKMSGGRPMPPHRMVTHSWSNLFRDLIAAIFADALEQPHFESIAHMLDHNPTALQRLLTPKMLALRYWVCAFAVNQHQSICGAVWPGNHDTRTGEDYLPCRCGNPAVLNCTPPLNDDGKSIRCEMNKFSDMIAHLAANDPNFCQIVAIDRECRLFSRAWCVAELAEAHKVGSRQLLKVSSRQVLENNIDGLRGLDISKMQAARQEDVDEILANIPHVPRFNSHLQDMLFGECGLLEQADSYHMVEQAGLIARATVISLAGLCRACEVTGVHRPPWMAAMERLLLLAREEATHGGARAPDEVPWAALPKTVAVVEIPSDRNNKSNNTGGLVVVDGAAIQQDV